MTMKTIIVMLLMTANGFAADLWERMRDCAAQAEKLKKEQQEKNKALDKEWKAKGYIGDSPYRLAVGDNHYSLKYGRCYVELTEEAPINPVQHVLNVIDAFEGRLIAKYDWSAAFGWSCYDNFGNFGFSPDNPGGSPEGCQKVLYNMEWLMTDGLSPWLSGMVPGASETPTRKQSKQTDRIAK
jgi:hypothetical protein